MIRWELKCCCPGWPCCCPALWSLPPIPTTSRSVSSVWKVVSTTSKCSGGEIIPNNLKEIEEIISIFVKVSVWLGRNRVFSETMREQLTFLKYSKFLKERNSKFISAKVHVDLGPSIFLITRSFVVNKWFPLGRTLSTNCNVITLIMLPAVSHTTDDLIFEWYPPESIPLVVEPLQLPQLELIHNTTEDCTTSYSTGARDDNASNIK